MMNESFSQISQEQEQQQFEDLENNENYPQFSQAQNSQILSEIINVNQQQKQLQKKQILLPQSNGLFTYLIDNQSRIYDIFQNFLHRQIQYYIIKKTLDQNIIQNYIELQGVKRKLAYVQQVYNQVFGALKNCIQLYQEKILIMTSEIDKEDPYSLLTQHEIDLRRGLHDFYQFIDSEDLITSSKIMSASQNIGQDKISQFDQFNPCNLLTIENIASFLLNSLEMEQISITQQELLNDEITKNLLTVTLSLMQIWQHLFSFLIQYNISNIQFNYEVDPGDHNASIVAALTLLLVPQDIASKILKSQTKELLQYNLKGKNKLPLKNEYEQKYTEKQQPKLQIGLNFDKFENIIKIVDDALTNEVENFSFSNAEHSLNEELSDQQQTIQKQNKYLWNSEQYKQTILDQAFELSFKGKINEQHLINILPPKHRSYIAECGENVQQIPPNSRLYLKQKQ